MPKRVYELAKELGYDKQMLVTKINALDVGIKGCNPFTALSDDEVNKIKSALKSAKTVAAEPSSAEEKETVAAAGEQETALPVRRRSKKKSSEEDEETSGSAAASSDAAVGPRIIRRSRKTTAADDAADAHEDAHDDVQESAPEAVEVDAQPEPAQAPQEVQPAEVVEVVQPEPVAEVKPEPEVVQEAPAPKPEPVAEVKPEVKPEPVTETPKVETPVAAAPVAEPAKPAEPAESKAPEADKPARRVQRVGGGGEARAADAGNTDNRAGRGTAAPAPQSAAPAAPTPRRTAPGGAKILGRIDLGTMQDRMDNDRFGAPAPAPERRSNNNNRSNDRSSDSNARPSAPRTAGPSDNRSSSRDSAPGSADRNSGGNTAHRNDSTSGAGGSGSGAGKRRGERDDERGDRGRRQVRERESIYDGRGGRGKGGKGGKGGKQVKAKKPEITLAAEHKRVVRIEETTTVGDLGREMGVKAGLLAFKLLELGIQGNVNTTIDYDTATLLAEQFGYTVENVAFDISRFYDTTPDDEETLQPRPPIVTVMGHVDHGKTSLLDAIRSSSVTSGEAGGITQHIGAYTVQTGNGGQITFLDTPGHEAFTALRARGAQATDIVVLVVAADDGVMPQTVEAINHARAAEVPIIVAVNKVDKPSANPDRVKQALIEYNLQPEEWGGSTQFVEVSALKRTNIEGLMEALLLQAEIGELTARPDRDAQGIVIESRLDKGRGPLASILVQRGTLRPGNIVVIGEHYGRVRNMVDNHGKDLAEAGPSIPVEITGLSGVPEAGEPFFVVSDEKDAKRITEHVGEQNRQKHMAQLAKSGMAKLQDLLAKRDGEHEGERKKLKVIIKGDVQGSIEALRQSFSKQGNAEVSVDVIHSAVGAVTENDVNLAASTNDAVVIIGFSVRPDPRAMEVAEKYGVEIMTFNIIYDAIDAVRNLLEGLLSPVEREKVLGHAEVRETFQAPKVGTIAGLYVTDGMLRRNAKARLLRNGKVIYTTTLATLRRFKDDVREVQKGFECGASLHNYNDIKIGDVIEAYEIEEVAATLD